MAQKHEEIAVQKRNENSWNACPDKFAPLQRPTGQMKKEIQKSSQEPHGLKDKSDFHKPGAQAPTDQNKRRTARLNNSVKPKKSKVLYETETLLGDGLQARVFTARTHGSTQEGEDLHCLKVI